MTKKYGKGDKSVMKCQSCSYEKDIFSSGVHNTEGGSLMVHDVADDFFCPNCNMDNNAMADIVEKPGKYSRPNLATLPSS